MSDRKREVDQVQDVTNPSPSPQPSPAGRGGQAYCLKRDFRDGVVNAAEVAILAVHACVALDPAIHV